jgi:predicted dehydrogenase
MHAPTLAAGPETALTAVWARRAEAAAALAREHGAVAAGSFEELLDRCEAVAFAVPPDVQDGLAVPAARAGKALLLEKPVAPTLDLARAVAAAVAEAGVVSQLVLTKRYHPRTREFLTRAARVETIGARSCYLHGGFLGGEQASPWRLADHGVLLDLGPHLLDLLDAAVGPIVEVRAAGDPARWVELTCAHAGGATSQASLSGSVALPRASTVVELFGPAGVLRYDTAGIEHAECWPVLRAEFAAAVRSGRAPELDVRRGVRLQELIAQAIASQA